METKKFKITFCENGSEQVRHSTFPPHYTKQDVVEFYGLDAPEVSSYSIEEE